jgi:hypothetical protein
LDEFLDAYNQRLFEKEARKCGDRRWIFGVLVIFQASAFILNGNGTWAQDGSEAVSNPGAHLVLALDGNR